MKGPDAERRMPKEPRSPKAEIGWRSARSVLDCGGSLPLFLAVSQSADESEHSKTWRASGARDLSRLDFMFARAFGASPATARLAARSGLKSALLRTLALCLLTSVLGLPAAAQYALDWFTLDGGGGTSTGGVYSVSGTIGQPDAGEMSGGNFTLQGGFWSVIAAVQTPGAPYLTVARSNHAVIVSWPLPAAGWRLHATTNLLTAGSVWTEIPPPYQTNSANLQFTEPSPAGNKFYRLKK